jgi:hypothetical protein
MVEPTRCGTTSQDSAGDIFGLLARWRRLVRRGMQLVDFEPRWWSGGLIRVPRSGALLPSSLTAIPETCSERGAVQRGWRSLRTRERGMLSCGLEVPAHTCDAQRRKWRGPRALGCFGLGVLHVVGRSAWVQQHCGGGSCTAVTLSVRWCLLLSSSISGGSLQWCRYTQEHGLWVEVAAMFCLPCHRCE